MLEEKHDNLHIADGQANQETQKNVITSPTLPQSAQDAIDNSNAEENEDESLQDKHGIPMLDYDSLSMEELTTELDQLIHNNKVMAIKDHVEEIRKAFMDKYHHFLDDKRDEFNTINTDETATFEYHFPLKNKFDSIYEDYKSNRNAHYNQLQKNLKSNLEIRNELIEELKALVDNTDETLSIGDMFNKLSEIRQRWKNAGAIPRDKYNIVWNNFHFHIERFYDLMHLDKEARDQDFKNNLEQKLQIIARAKDLLNETDIIKAFRELQLLHRVWKEEVGPVDHEHRENIWNEFSEITHQMHEKREAYFGQAKERESKNLAIKNNLIAEIITLGKENITSHNGWQAQIKKMEVQRDNFFKAGKVPAEVNEATWAAFKNAVREFNSNKNSFYKDIKHEQQENLNKKLALVEKAVSLKDSENYNATTPIMKQIQDEWRKIGHVPRKHSDTIWKEFKNACNHYFDRLHKVKNAENQEEIEAFDKKKEYLENLKSFELVGEHKTDLDAIKAHIEAWKTIGKVPFNRRHIEGKFNKILDALFEKLSLSKKDTEMLRFDAKLEQMVENEDERAIEKEQYFIKKRIEETQNEIFQLENNIQFISSSSKNKGENPFIKEVNKSIEHHKEELKLWKEKLSKLRAL